MTLASAPASSAQVVDLARVIERARPAVVTIHGEGPSGERVLGSGFVVRQDGMVATSAHVVAGQTALTVTLASGERLSVTGIAAINRARDLAILETDGQELPSLGLGDSDRVRLGEPVVALGSPLGLEGTVSIGHVSGIRRDLLQTTAPVSPGSSGGPLVNQAGEVIGVIRATLIGGQNLNFAAAANRLRELPRASRQRGLPSWPGPTGWSGACSLLRSDILTRSDKTTRSQPWLGPWSRWI
jgi:S1-C subfamily serine protease